MEGAGEAIKIANLVVSEIVHDEDENESPVVEMSQDCVVWDESHNTDLRAGPIGVLDHLVKDTSKKHHTIQNRFQNPFIDVEQHRSPSPNQEIETIFDVLGTGSQEEIVHTADTQIATNTATAVQGFPIPSCRLAGKSRRSFPTSRNSGRKRTGASSTVRIYHREKVPKNTELQRMTASTTTSPAPIYNDTNLQYTSTPMPHQKFNLSTQNVSDFDDLLQRIKTPSPDQTAATAIATNQSKENTAQDSHTNRNHRHEKQLPNQSTGLNHAGDDAELKTHLASVNNIRPKSLASQTFPKPRPSKPQPTSDKENILVNNTDLSGIPGQTYNQIARKSQVNKQSSTPLTSSSKSVHPPSSNKQQSANQPMRAVPNQTSMTKHTSTEIFDEFGDEWGGLELDDEVFAEVDSLVAATQRQNNHCNQQPQHQANASLASSNLPQVSSIAPLAIPRTVIGQPRPANKLLQLSSSNVPATNVTQKHAITDPTEIDPFDDLFLDNIDFAALDQAIATQQPYRLCSGHSSTSNLPTVSDSECPVSIEYPIPPVGAVIQNPRADNAPGGLSFTRYRVEGVKKDIHTYTKTVLVKVWDSTMLDEGNKMSIHRTGKSSKLRAQQMMPVGDVKPLFLRGSMYYVDVEVGDILHLCSLSGSFRTDPSALPVILHTAPPPGSDEDDLIMVLHPDLLSIPTKVTGMLACRRRAVLSGRLGSTGMSSKKMLFGTMRHSLFERTLRERNFTKEFAQRQVSRIVRENAESMISCNMSSSEAEQELIKIVPQLQTFEREYLNPQRSAQLRGNGGMPSIDIGFAVKSVTGVEEPVVSAELGLKGNIDVTVEAAIAANRSRAVIENALMGIELKTNHNTKTQNEHTAQLSLYIAMLLSKYGKNTTAIFKDVPLSHEAIGGGMLLYLNGETMRAEHVSPNLRDIKNLMEQRNEYTSSLVRAMRPRGVTLVYEDDKDSPRVEVSKAPAVSLPHIEQSSFMCSKCFAARECTLYADAEVYATRPLDEQNAKNLHPELSQQFTNHLKDKDFEYFLEWDRLIDLEDHATHNSVAEAWLLRSEDRERATGQSISSLTFDYHDSGTSSGLTLDEAENVVFICFKRSADSPLLTAFSSLHLSEGCYVTCSTDTSSLSGRSLGISRVRLPNSELKDGPFRHQMHIFRGMVECIEGDDKIKIRASQDDLRRILRLIDQYKETVSASSGAAEHVELHFRLDKDDLSSQMGALRQNLLNLFTRDRESVDERNKDHRMRHDCWKQRLPWLRELIVQLRRPLFDERLRTAMFNTPPAIKSYPGCDLFDLMVEFSELNEDQRAAAEKVTSMKDYTLIQGLPGTGKTSTIVFLARLLVAQGKRVLITSYTHSAVDNVMLKLMDREVAALYEGRRLPALVRVGKQSSCHPTVQPLLVSNLAADFEGVDIDNPSAESLRTVMSEARIVGATTLTVPRSPLLLSERFDVVVVDEAGQISQPAVLGALACADSFILVGDHQQLPPLVNSELADEAGYGVSMLKRLAEAHPDCVQQLKYQYRMHPEICKLSSDAIYDGKLVTRIDIPLLHLPAYPKALNFETFGNAADWIKRLVNPYRPVVFANTDGMTRDARTDRNPSSSSSSLHDRAIVPLERTASKQTGGNIANETEATLVGLIVKGLIATGLGPSSIGVICPFRAQIRLLEECPLIAQWKKNGLEISTIDRYQGRDKEAIVLSFVRSNNKGKVGRLLEDKRRINVAITRAKHKMIMVGSLSTLMNGSKVLKTILRQIEELKLIERLPNDAIRSL